MLALRPAPVLNRRVLPGCNIATSVLLRPSSLGSAHPAVQMPLRSCRIQAMNRSRSSQEEPRNPASTPTAAPLARIAAQIILAAPFAAVLLGLYPRGVIAATATPPLPPSTARVIDETTGMPQKWTYSAGDWSQEKLKAIFDHYDRPTPAFHPQEHPAAAAKPAAAMAQANKAASNAPASSTPAAAAVGATAAMTPSAFRADVGRAILSQIDAIRTAAAHAAASTATAVEALKTVASEKLSAATAAVRSHTSANTLPGGHLAASSALTHNAAAASKVDSKPPTLIPLSSPQGPNNGVLPLPGTLPSFPTPVVPPQQVQLAALAIVMCASAVWLAWRKSHPRQPLRGEAVEGLDTSIISTSTAPEVSAEDAVWHAGRGVPLSADICAFTSTSIEEESYLTQAGMTGWAGRSKAELVAESERRIAAAKALMAKTAAAEAIERNSGGGFVDVEEDEEEQTSPTMLQEAMSALNMGFGTLRTAIGVDDNNITSAAVAADSALPSPFREVHESMFSLSGENEANTAAGHSSPSFEDVETVAAQQQLRRSNRAAAAASHDPLSAFVGALDAKSPATPLLAVLGLTAAAVSGMASVISTMSSPPPAPTAAPSNEDSDAAPTPTAPSWSAMDLLLAPAAPLLAYLPPNSAGAASVTSPDKYNPAAGVLRAAAPPSGRDSKYSLVREFLDAVAPVPSPPSKYDPIRKTLQELAAGQNAPPQPPQKYDMVRQLLSVVAAPTNLSPEGAAAADRYAPTAKDALHFATLLADWGPDFAAKMDPLHGVVGSVAASDWTLREWAGPSEYCPVSAMLAASAPEITAASLKYDPVRAGIKRLASAGWEGPVRGSMVESGGNRYDPMDALLGGILNAQAPKTGDVSAKGDPMADLRGAAAQWRPPAPRADSPQSALKFDPLAAALAAAAAAEAPSRRDGGAAWDPFSWVMAGWAGGWGDGSGEEESAVRSFGKYDPAAGVLRATEPSRKKSKFDLVQAFLHLAPIGRMAEKSGDASGHGEAGNGGHHAATSNSGVSLHHAPVDASVDFGFSAAAATVVTVAEEEAMTSA